MSVGSVIIFSYFVVTLIDRSFGGRMSAMASEIAYDPLSLFTMRSPGAREAGVLMQTKKRLSSREGNKPHERVLSVVRERPGLAGDSGALPLGFADASGLPADPASPFGPLPLLEPSTPTKSPAPHPSALLNAPLLPNFARSRRIDDSSSDTVIPAVPEPATWAMMIVGFFSIGLALRRQMRLAVNAGEGE